MYTKNEIQNRVVRRIATNYKCRVTVLKKIDIDIGVSGCEI